MCIHTEARELAVQEGHRAEVAQDKLTRESVLLRIAQADINRYVHTQKYSHKLYPPKNERWGAGVETQKNVRGDIGG